MRQALRCQRLTKLLTLQIHFLNTGQDTMLINLSRHRLTDCITALPRFYQVSARAQQYRRPRLSWRPCHRAQRLCGFPGGLRSASPAFAA